MGPGPAHAALVTILRNYGNAAAAPGGPSPPGAGNRAVGTVNPARPSSQRAPKRYYSHTDADADHVGIHASDSWRTRANVAC